MDEFEERRCYVMREDLKDIISVLRPALPWWWRVLDFLFLRDWRCLST